MTPVSRPILHRRLALAGLAVALVLPACREMPPQDPAALDPIAREFIVLALALGQDDPDYVDSYYGPDSLRAIATRDSARLTLPVIRASAESLLARLGERRAYYSDSVVSMRHANLRSLLVAMVGRIGTLSGDTIPFDDEARLYFGMAPPRVTDAHYDSLLAALDARLPGPGSLAQRYRALTRRLEIPPSRVDTVFRVALAACRARTLAHLPLPPGDRVDFEYVRGVPWSTYMRFDGDFASHAEVNRDLPILIPSAVDFGCHDGYPGWHVYNVLNEEELVRKRGWVEFTIAPLFSVQSLVADGIATVGLELAFPDPERIAFERDTLFPLAGIDPALATTYAPILGIMAELATSDVEVARRYLSGSLDRAAAERLVSRYRLTTPEASAKLVQFMDAYRSYVMISGVGRDRVRAFLEKHGGGTVDGRWRAFGALLRSPPPQLGR